MELKRKRAIAYAIARKKKAEQEAFLIEREGSLTNFKLSGYRSITWYIKSKFKEILQNEANDRI